MKNISKKTGKSIFLLSFLALAFIIIGASFGSAVFWACFNKGEVINFCNPATPDRTCGDSIGCSYCMGSFNATRGCYNQGSLNACNAIPFECQNGGINSTIDSLPPTITVIKPVEGSVNTKASLLFTVKLSEHANAYYQDTLNSPGKWTQICRNCLTYNQTRFFKEGSNELIIKATDMNNNTAFTNLSFFVDTKKPSITKTLPIMRSFASGEFSLDFIEKNPASILLRYGNNATGFRSSSLDLGDCTLANGRYSCSTQVSLLDYGNNTITYWFNVSDIAGASAQTKPVQVNVDTILPIMNSVNISKVKIGSSTRFDLIFNVTEQNFKGLSYIDNSVAKPKWTTLCLSLSKGICKKSLTFSASNITSHSIDVQIDDKAGNSIGTHLDLNI